MKVDREFSFEELPERVRTSIEELVKAHTESLVNDYSDTLRRDAKHITWDEKEFLVERISQAAKITVKISAKCDADVLSNCKIYPRDAYQNKLDDFEKRIVFRTKETIKEAEEEGEFSQEERTSLEEKDAALYEKRKAAAKAVEEGSA